MTNQPDLLPLVLPVFLVIASGYALRRAGVFTEEGDRSLLGILVNLLVPCLALDVIIGNEALERPANWIIPPLLGFIVPAMGYLLCLVAARLFWSDVRKARTFASVAGLQNYGYIALPICLALFDRDVVGVLLAFNMGVDIAMWTLGVALMPGGHSKGDWKKIVLSPPIVSVAAGIALNALGAGHWVPQAVDGAWHMLGLCAVPLGLLVTGAVLADHMRPRMLRSGWDTTLLALLLRLGVLPALILAAGLWLPLNPPMRTVLVVQSAMPSAVFPVVLAKLHGGDMPTALRVVLGTSLASLVTIPLWLGWAMKFLH
ncbi:MAG: AEC family transporter [bacterium]